MARVPRRVVAIAIALGEGAATILALHACTETELPATVGFEGGTDRRVVPAVPTGDASLDAEPICTPAAPTRSSRSSPPRPWSPSCSVAQIGVFADSCLSGFATRTVCQAYERQNADCTQCLTSKFDDPVWAALVTDPTGAAFFPNVGGCIAHMRGDPPLAGCGPAAGRVADCRQLACSSCPTDTPSDVEALVACTQDDRVAPLCSSDISYYDATCIGFGAGDPASTCFAGPNETPEALLHRYMQMWCGFPSDTDATTDAPD